MTIVGAPLAQLHEVFDWKCHVDALGRLMGCNGAVFEIFHSTTLILKWCVSMLNHKNTLITISLRISNKALVKAYWFFKKVGCNQKPPTRSNNTVYSFAVSQMLLRQVRLWDVKSMKWQSSICFGEKSVSVDVVNCFSVFCTTAESSEQNVDQETQQT